MDMLSIPKEASIRFRRAIVTAYSLDIFFQSLRKLLSGFGDAIHRELKQHDLFQSLRKLLSGFGTGDALTEHFFWSLSIPKEASIRFRPGGDSPP